MSHERCERYKFSVHVFMNVEIQMIHRDNLVVGFNLTQLYRNDLVVGFHGCFKVVVVNDKFIKTLICN